MAWEGERSWKEEESVERAAFHEFMPAGFGPIVNGREFSATVNVWEVPNSSE